MIAQAMTDTGCFQASKTLLTIGYAYFRILKLNNQSRERLNTLKIENNKNIIVYG